MTTIVTLNLTALPFVSRRCGVWPTGATVCLPRIVYNKLVRLSSRHSRSFADGSITDIEMIRDAKYFIYIGR